MDSSSEITELLREWNAGNKEALQKLTPLLYRELHRIAHRYMSRERPEHTLQTTALVNEAYVRLMDWESAHWENRAHFLGVTAHLMRRILVDFSRVRNHTKRGGGTHSLSLEEALTVSSDRAGEIVELDEALQKLAAIDPRKSQIAELRFFGGLSMEETARVLKVSVRTLYREWDLTKAWLHRELCAENAD